MRKDDKELIRPTVRINKEWYEELKKIIKEKDTTFQELTLQLLEEWFDENK